MAFYGYEGKEVELSKSTTHCAVRYGGAAAPGGLALGDGIFLYEVAAAPPSPLPEGASFLPLFLAPGGGMLILTEELNVKFKPGVTQSQVEALHVQHKVAVRGTLDWEENAFLLAVQGTGEEPLEVAKRYQQSGLTLYAEPNFLQLLKLASVPKAPYFSEQWALLNTGQHGGSPGEDIRATEAWELSRGSPDICVAIVDDGLDYTHPEFAGPDKLPAGWDAALHTPLFLTNDHGTACAAIVAANGNLSGVAPLCRILGVRVGHTPPESAFFVATAKALAAGIALAAQRADVLLCGWSGGAPLAVTTQAIRYAKEKGRKGRGCLVCFPAGNEDGPVRYPANLPEVFTVAASNPWGERKSPTSRDGGLLYGEAWGSNFGPEVDVCAPGVHIYTAANGGGNASPAYFASFAGTSASAAYAAGTAALLLSYEAELSSSRVESLLRESADRTLASPPGRNNDTGYGRINAAKALKAARQMPRWVVGDFGADAKSGWRTDMHPRFLADLTGNGRADIVGFGSAGVVVAFSKGDGTFEAPKMVVNNFAQDAGGWRVDMHPRFLANITGNGRADIVGFGGAGVWVSLNKGNGTFEAPKMVVNNFGADANAGGWRVDMHPRFLADITGNGRADIVGFGNAGVWVSLNKGNGTFEAPKMVLNNFGADANAGGWRVDMHPRFLANITGNGRADIVGFGNAGVWVSLNKGNGTFEAPKIVVENFGHHAGGWRVDMHPRFLADLTGNGRADIVGFGNAGVWVSLNKGNGTFEAPKMVVNNFGADANAGGWRVDMHPRFLADITGNGRADIVGFGNAGVWVSLNKGNGTFEAPQMVVNNFGADANAGGWRVDKHPRFLADITGNGRADIVGFGEAGVWVALSRGDGRFY